MCNYIKIKFTLNQLISNTFYLGYNRISRNVKFNYFLLGESNSNDLINLNLTYILIKKYLSFLINIFSLDSRVWIINNNFLIFSKISVFQNLSYLFTKNSQIYFPKGRFIIGSFTNFKNVSSFKTWNFPHVVFFPSIFNNYYIVNECFTIGIPTFGVCDTNENPNNLMFVIPGNSKSLSSLVLVYLLIIRSFFYSKVYKSSKFLMQVLENIYKKKNKLLKRIDHSIIKSNLRKKYYKFFCKEYFINASINKYLHSFFFKLLNNNQSKSLYIFNLLKRII